MHVQTLLVTPDEAKRLLQQNTKNRPINKSHVLFFEEQLRNGEMQLTHQGIAISENGVLLDGQHRLTAIVSTGISAVMLVATGLPDKVFSVLDTGAKRKASDVIAIDGACNATAMAASIRLYKLYNKFPEYVWTGKYFNAHVTPTEIQKEVRLDFDGWQLTAHLASNFTIPKIVAPGPMGCLFYIAHRQNGYSISFLEKFGLQLKAGANLDPGDPILAYRNKLLFGFRSGNIIAQERLADYIKLFNAFATGQKLKIFKSQKYPPMPALVHSAESIYDDAK